MPLSAAAVVVAFSPDDQVLACSPDSQWLVAGLGGGDLDIHAWNLSTRVETRLAGHSLWISALAFSPDGKRLASVSADHTLRLWNVARRTELRRLAV